MRPPPPPLVSATLRSPRSALPTLIGNGSSDGRDDRSRGLAGTGSYGAPGPPASAPVAPACAFPAAMSAAYSSGVMRPLGSGIRPSDLVGVDLRVRDLVREQAVDQVGRAVQRDLRRPQLRLRERDAPELR